MKAKQILFGFLTVIGAASCSEEMEYKEYVEICISHGEGHLIHCDI